MRALVLSGGGAKGAYEAGLAITLMQEFGEEFDIVCGTSIGAINASFIAQGKLTELAGVWSSIAQAQIVAPDRRVVALQNIFASLVSLVQAKLWLKAFVLARTAIIAFVNIRVLNPLESLIGMTGALSPTGAQKMLASHLDLDAVKRVLIISVTDVTLRAQQVFYCFPDRYADAQAHFVHEEPQALPFDKPTFSETVRASGAIPAAFAPVTLPYPPPGNAYVDGGVTNNTPIGQAIDAGADDITIVYVDPAAVAAKAPTANIPDILASCFSMMQQCILDLDYKTALRVNDAVSANADDTRHKSIVKIRTFRPKAPLAVGVIDFSKQLEVTSAFQAGQADARDAAQRSTYSS